MKFSLWPSNERTPADLLDQARTADETGWYRDPATMRTSVNAIVDLDGAALPPGRASLFGSPQQLVDQFGQYAELGFDEFVLPDWNLGRDKSQRADRLARIKAEVFDRLS